jgi:hypothetical protein
VVASSSREEKGTFTITAEQAGRYTYCFSNKMSSVTAKSVNFNAHVNEKNEVDANGKFKTYTKKVEPIQ